MGAREDEAEGEEGGVGQARAYNRSLATRQGFFSVPSLICPIDSSYRSAAKLSALLLHETGYGSAQGQEMREQIVEPFPDREICDFCTTEPTQRLYACRNFMWLKRTMFAHESVGAWSACEICAEFVDAGRWTELTERALAQFKKTHGYSQDEEPYFREQFRELHRLFQEHLVKES